MSTVRLTALAFLLLLATPAAATAAPTANDVRIASRPGFVRVVVAFTGGTFQLGETQAVDPAVADGTARVEVRRPGIAARSVDRTAAGIRARLRGASGSVVIRLSAARRAFKYVRVSALRGPSRLVVDLYAAGRPCAARRFAPRRIAA